MELSVRKEFRLYRIAKLIRSKFCRFRKISHTLAKEINNKSLEVSALRSIADINYSLKNFAQAIDFNEKYAALAKSIGETENEILALESIAGIYYNNKEWEKIAESYKRILEIHRRTNNKKAEAETLNFIGVVKSNGENYQETIEFYKQSAELAAKLKLPDFREKCLNRIPSSQKQVAEAEILTIF